MTGQDAVNVAESFNSNLGIDGVVLTKLDGDTRGGAALYLPVYSANVFCTLSLSIFIFASFSLFCVPAGDGGRLGAGWRTLYKGQFVRIA